MIEVKKLIIKELEQQGIDFKKSVWILSNSHIFLLDNYAREMKFRKSKNRYYSIGKDFFIHLQKIKNRG